MAFADRASGADAATRGHAGLRARAIQPCVAGGQIIPASGQGPDGTGRKAGPIRATFARVGRWRQIHGEGKRQRPAKGQPQPSLRMNKHAHRAGPGPPALPGPCQERWPWRPVRGEDGRTAELLCNTAQHALGPSVQRIGGTIGPFGAGGDDIPKPRAPHRANKHECGHLRRTMRGIWPCGTQRHQPLGIKQAMQPGLGPQSPSPRGVMRGGVERIMDPAP